MSGAAKNAALYVSSHGIRGLFLDQLLLFSLNYQATPNITKLQDTTILSCLKPAILAYCHIQLYKQQRNTPSLAETQQINVLSIWLLLQEIRQFQLFKHDASQSPIVDIELTKYR